MTVEIAPFRPEHASRFAELNREWLQRYNLMEPANEEQLADPQAHFLDRGGQILVALDDGNVIGTCAVVPHGTRGWEIAKLAVSSEFQGQGIARRLVERCIAHTRVRGAQRVYLVSNSQLQPALRLYESLGFQYGEAPAVREYENEDVYMELRLEAAEPPP
jgi:ribosomal protein S18 acetylase RimI-like enzyme